YYYYYYYYYYYCYCYNFFPFSKKKKKTFEGIQLLKKMLTMLKQHYRHSSSEEWKGISEVLMRNVCINITGYRHEMLFLCLDELELKLEDLIELTFRFLNTLDDINERSSLVNPKILMLIDLCTYILKKASIPTNDPYFGTSKISSDLSDICRVVHALHQKYFRAVNPILLEKTEPVYHFKLKFSTHAHTHVNTHMNTHF
ncbi:hypothetical protein RFI_13518, partial [Reticulomyxa filosa]